MDEQQVLIPELAVIRVRERFNEVLGQRGYVVMEAWSGIDHAPGDVIKNVRYRGVPMEHPVYVLRETDRQDFLDQHDESEFRTGTLLPGMRYWRVGTD